MKFVLFRSENDTLHYLVWEIISGNISIEIKHKLVLEWKENRWEKYNCILEELKNIDSKYKPDFLSYQSPQKYRWAIKDEEWFANSAIINLYSFQNNKKLYELTPVLIRNSLSIWIKEYKELFEATKKEVVNSHNITKSDKLTDWLVLLTLLKDNL